MIPTHGPQERIVDRLERLLAAARKGRADLAGLSSLFLVGLIRDPSPETRAWLDRALQGRGRILLAEGDPLPPDGETNKAPSKPGSAGVGPEEKSILWGK